MSQRSFGKISSVLLPMIIAVPFGFEPLSHSLAEDDLEIRKRDCERYAQKAIEQVTKYTELKCTDTTDSARWNPDEKAHFGWCFLLTESDAVEANYTSRQEMIDAALNSREDFLAICKQGDGGTTAAGGSIEEVELKCPERIGSTQFRPNQVKKYFTPPKVGADLGTAVCDFYLDGGGEIRLEGRWLANFVEWPVSSPGQLGCDKTETGGSYQETKFGMNVTSNDRHAVAHMSGNTDAAVKLIHGHYLGPLGNMFNFAHLRARPCH